MKLTTTILILFVCFCVLNSSMFVPKTKCNCGQEMRYWNKGKLVYVDYAPYGETQTVQSGAIIVEGKEIKCDHVESVPINQSK
jgi:hypothetical protein